jgi:hypothetical protein
MCVAHVFDAFDLGGEHLLAVLALVDVLTGMFHLEQYQQKILG